jgi:hypothetical protein
MVSKDSGWELSGENSYQYGMSSGLFGGGLSSITFSSVIDYINISTTGNATSFGDLTVQRGGLAGCASRLNAYFGGGLKQGTGQTVAQSLIDRVGFNSGSTVVNFGNLTLARFFLSSCSSNTIGLFAGGRIEPQEVVEYTNIIDHITLTTSGSASSFGNLTSARVGTSSCSSPTRGIFSGGMVFDRIYENVIDYVTISTTGNASDFGDLTVARVGLSACSSSTRGVFTGGSIDEATETAVIDYITIASQSNALNFGSLSSSVWYNAGVSNSIYGVFGGGLSGGHYTNTMEYLEIAATGATHEFGDLTQSRSELGGCGNGHGGLL